MQRPALAEAKLQPWLSTHLWWCMGSCFSMVALTQPCWRSSIGAAMGSEGHLQPGAVAWLHLLSCSSPPASSAGLCTNIPLLCNNLQLRDREEDGGWGTSSFLSPLGKYGTRAWQVQLKGIFTLLSEATMGRLPTLWRVFLWLLWVGTVACSRATQAKSSLAGYWKVPGKVNGGTCTWSACF